MLFHKRAITAYGIFIFICALLCACQPTPESSIVVGSEPNYTSADDKCTIGELIIPEIWIEKDMETSKTYRISANACIEVPHITECRNIIVKRAPFDSTKIEKIAKLFVEDMSQIYMRDINLTKQEILEMIIAYERQLAQKSEERDMSPAEINTILNDLYTRLETAPETKQQGILSFNSKSEGDEYIGEFLLNNRKTIIFGIMNGTSLYIAPGGVTQYEGLDWGDGILKIDDIGISEQKAADIAELFVSSLPCDNMALIDTKKAQLVEPSNEYIIPLYVMVYGKTNNGLSTVDVGTGYTVYPTTMASEYAAPWPQDIILVYVSRDGVIGCEWNGASEIDYVDKSECELIPFSQVQTRIREQMKYRYSYLEDEKYARIDPIDICIDKIKFGYCITGVKGNAERARLVPAWYVLYREFAEENGEGTEAVMVLNAETGALMDPRIVSDDNSTAE